MQLSKLNLALTRIGKASFSPKSLFSSGAQGAWYDPSDYSTMFEDAAGTIPITSPLEKPVGLMLDKSKGLVLGPELVTNGDFSQGTTGWESGTGAAKLTVVNGEAKSEATATSSSFLYRSVAFVTSYKVYKVEFEIYSPNFSGSVRCSLNDSTLAPYSFTTPVSTTKTKGMSYLMAGPTPKLWFTPTQAVAAGTIIYFDNISVRELPGNHAYQSTTTSRPTLSARYNLLTKTEEFDDVAWAKDTCTAPVVSVTNPVGGSTANALTDNATLNRHMVSQSTAYVATTYAGAVYAKANTLSRIMLVEFGSNKGIGFDLSNGTTFTVTGVTAPAGGTYSITDAGNGWYRCSINITTAASGSAAIFGIYTISGTAYSYSGSGQSVYIWGADLRVANDGIGLPAYQRVNTATDYDYAGFPPYLRFDGTDDSMATGNIDFTGTDKMSVFAGVRKLADSGYPIIAELSASLDSNNGSFNLYGAQKGTSSTPAYTFRSKGTTLIEVASPLSYASPVTNVISGIGDISAPTVSLRINTSAIDTQTGSQGTGNYGKYPLYIGARAGGGLWFNGRLYSLVVCGKLASAAEITATEAYINQKTRAY